MLNNRKTRTLLPKGFNNILIKILSSDEVLDKLADITLHFLNATWLMADETSRKQIKYKFFDKLIEETILTQLNAKQKIQFSKENLNHITQCIIQKFLDPINNNLLSEKLLLEGFSSKLFQLELRKDLIIVYIMRKITVNTLEAVRNPELMMKETDRDKKLQNLLVSTVQKRLDFIKEHTDITYVLATNPWFYIREADFNESHRRYFIGSFLFLVIVTSSVSYFFPNLRFDSVVPYFLILLGCYMAAKFLSKQLVQISNQHGFANDFLAKQIIIKEILTALQDFNQEEEQTQEIKSQSISSKSKEPKQEQISKATDSYSDLPNGREKELSFFKKTVFEKIKTIEDRIEQHIKKDNTQELEIKWEKVNLIYKPFKDFYKFIELWSANPSQKHYNKYHYILWDEQKIQAAFAKKKKAFLYQTFFYIGQLGRIARSEKDQGFVPCTWQQKEEEGDFKLKSLGTDGAAKYGIFFNKIDTTKIGKDGKNLYEFSSFQKKH